MMSIGRFAHGFCQASRRLRGCKTKYRSVGAASRAPRQGRANGRRGETASRLSGGEIRRRLVEITRSTRGSPRPIMGHFVADVIVHYNCTKEGLFSPWALDGRGKLPRKYAAHRRRISGARRRDRRNPLVKVAMLRCAGARGGGTAATGVVYRLDMAYFLRWRGDGVIEMHEFLEPGPPTILASSGCEVSRTY